MATVHDRVEPALMVAFSRGLPSQSPVASNSGVLYRLPKSPYNFSMECFDADD